MRADCAVRQISFYPANRVCEFPHCQVIFLRLVKIACMIHIGNVLCTSLVGSARRDRTVLLLDIWKLIVDEHVERDPSADDR